MEEALIEMYPGRSVCTSRRGHQRGAVGQPVSASTISDLNQKAYVHIEKWRQRPLSGKYPYVYADGIYLKRTRGGEFENVSILVAIGVDEEGYLEVIGVAEA